jgi:hypothetical protein
VRPHLAGKLLVDCTVPLVPPKVGLVQLPAAGCAATLAAAAAGEGVDVAAAFHNVSAKLLQGDGPIDCDVLVFADDAEVRARGCAGFGLRAAADRGRAAGEFGGCRGADIGADPDQPSLQVRPCRYPDHRAG